MSATDAKLTQAALARALGLSAPAVVKLKRQGMPTDSIEAAQAWRAARVRLRVKPKPAEPAPAATGEHVSYHEASRHRERAPRGEGAYAAPPDDVPDYNLERARRERYEADQAELRLAQMRGELVRAEDVKAAHQRKVAALREAFLQLPARVVPMLAADPTPAGMDAVLTREIHLAMAMLHEID